MENPAPPPPQPQREEDGGTMGAVVLGVNMGVHSPRGESKIRKKLMKVPGVVEVNVSLFTGHVGIVVTADPATLVQLLSSKLGMPVFLVADFRNAPAPPPVLMPPRHNAGCCCIL